MVVTSKGTTTTSRTAQALVSVTARHLSRHKTIARLIQRSAARRMARLSFQGRKAKLMTKVEMTSDVTPQPTAAVCVGPKNVTRKESLRLPKMGVREKQIAKNARRQERVRKLIAGAGKRQSKQVK